MKIYEILSKLAHNPADVSPRMYKIGTAIYFMLIVMFIVFSFVIYSFQGRLTIVQENVTNICVSVHTKVICDQFCDSGNCAVVCDGREITLEQLPYTDFSLSKNPFPNGTEIAEYCNRTGSC